MPDSIKETLRSDGTAFTVVGDSNILSGVLTNADGSPKYPIVISLAAEAVDDGEIAQLTNYVASGGFLFVGSSSFTRNTDGTTRGDFAIANAMGVHMVNTNLSNWQENEFFSNVISHPIVSHIPNGQLYWRMPLSADDISWGIAPNHPINALHLSWQVQVGDAIIVANGGIFGDGHNNSPYLLVKSYGKGYFIYDAAMQPLIGHGGMDSGMYAYGIFRNVIQWAFQSAKMSIPKLSPWPYQYDAAVLFRHDFEDYTNFINSIEASAQFENSVINSFGQPARGDYYFCTGTLRTEYGSTDQSNEIASLSRAITLYGATIGSHNGGLPNANDLSLSITNYNYWHWGPDEALDVTNPPPAGYSNGTTYAFVSISNSVSDLRGWGLTNGSGLSEFVSPSFNATRETSKQIISQLGIATSGEEKLGPFPHWTLSTQTSGLRYPLLSLPVSDWYVGTQVSQAIEEHTTESIDWAVDYYYNLGALINFYGHSAAAGSSLQQDDGGNLLTTSPQLQKEYLLHSMAKPRVWSANADAIYTWWLKRSTVQVTPTVAINGNQILTTMAIAGAGDTNTAVEFYAPSTNYNGLQVFTNGVQAGLTSYRIVGQTIRVLVGTAVTNAQVSYTIMPVAQNDTYFVQPSNTLTVAAPGVLVNDTPGWGTNLTAVLVVGPTNGSLTLNSNGGFSYSPTNSQTFDSFAYIANDGQTNSAVATVAITTINLPFITSQPASLTNAAGSSASFTVGSTSSVPVIYAWYMNATNQLTDGAGISGSATATLNIGSVFNVNAGAYTVVIANPVGSVTSAPPATLTVTGQLDPNIAGSPVGFVQNGGSTVELSVIATGTSPFTYQWNYDGSPIPGANSALVVLTGVTNSGGTYTVVVSNSLGSVTGTVGALQPMASGAIFSDNFVRGTDPDSISPWVAAVGGWTVTGQKLVSTSIAGNLANAYVNGTNWGDYCVQANVCFPVAGSAGAYGGGIGGHLNPATGARYAAWVYPEGSPSGSAVLNLVKFYDWVNWSGTPMQLTPVVLTNGVGTNWHTLNLAFHLNEITAYWDGSQVADVTDNNFSGLPPYWSGGITADVWANSDEQAMIVSNVVVSDFPATIISQPLSVVTNGGSTVSFNVTASGTAPMTYQWLKNGVALTDGGNVTGSSTTNLMLTNVSGTDQANYQVLLYNPFGSVTSSNAMLSLVGPPVITGQPVSVTATVGQTISFTIFAGGSSMTYQWFKNSNVITGAVNATLTLTNVAYSDAANYSVTVTNIYGGLTSSNATLTVQSCIQPPAGLISWWPGEGNANDIIGTNNGTLMGGATATNAGVVGSCFSFDGVNSYVQIPDSPTLQPTNLTIEAWVLFNSLDSSGSANPGHQYIVFKQNLDDVNFEGFSLGKDRWNHVPNPPATNGDVFYFLVSSSDGSQTAEADSAITISTNVWYHVAGVRGPNFVQIYVNGQLQGQSSVSFSQSYSSLPVYFGTSGENYWDGKLAGQLDEVSLYNRALSASEIAAIYSAGAGGKCTGTVNSGNPPVITNQPAWLAVVVSNNATFTVGVSGDVPLSYQWYFNGTNAVGINTNSLALPIVQVTDAGSYSVVITNAYGSVTSTPANLTVTVPPTITAQPQSLTLLVGATAGFNVAATGTPPPVYQWQLNGTNIPSATTNSFNLTNLQTTNAGIYSVLVTNLAGSVVSSNATLYVISAPPGLSAGINISSNLLAVTFATQVGPTYYLQYENSLAPNNWQTLTNVAGTGGSLTLSIPIGASAMQYFRLLVQ